MRFFLMFCFCYLSSAKRQKTHVNQPSDSSDDDDAPLATIVRGSRQQTEQVRADGQDEVAKRLNTKQESDIRQLKEMLERQERQMQEIRDQQEQQTVIFQRQFTQTTEMMENILSLVNNIQHVMNGKVDRKAERRQRLQEETRQNERQPNLQPLPRGDTPPRRPDLNRRDGRVSIVVGHEDMNPDRVYQDVEIPADEYDTIRGRCRTVTAFVRGIIGYFFTVDVLRESNFSGTTVLTKGGQIKKDQLDRRLVLSMLDHTELEFPGEVRDGHLVKPKLRDVINDKCRHA